MLCFLYICTVETLRIFFLTEQQTNKIVSSCNNWEACSRWWIHKNLSPPSYWQALPVILYIHIFIHTCTRNTSQSGSSFARWQNYWKAADHYNPYNDFFFFPNTTSTVENNIASKRNDICSTVYIFNLHGFKVLGQKKHLEKRIRGKMKKGREQSILPQVTGNKTLQMTMKQGPFNLRKDGYWEQKR